MTTIIYLAHLNPVTNSHIEIIHDLIDNYSKVVVMPVMFLKNGVEINSRSFPFNFEIRKKMLQAIFKNSILVSPNYTFYAPYWRYLPPIISPLSWVLKRKILKGIEKNYLTYTGDKAEWCLLKIYGLNPKKGVRRVLSATMVKDKIYNSAIGKKTNWESDVPKKVVEIINENWNVVKKFANKKDATIRITGMKFPMNGYWSQNIKKTRITS